MESPHTPSLLTTIQPPTQPSPNPTITRPHTNTHTPPPNTTQHHKTTHTHTPRPQTQPQEDRITFELGLEDAVNKEEMLDVFRMDPDFEQV